MFADLHIHTTNSDGLLSANEVIMTAQHKGIEVISITDHDTIKGLANLSNMDYIKIIPGIELTVTSRLHILGYFIDINNIELVQELEKIKLRKGRWLARLVNYLSKFYDISIKHVLQKYGELTVASISNYLLHLEEGNLKKQDIYSKYFWADIPGVGKFPGLSASTAIKLIHNAGGIAVLAHPSLIWKDERDFTNILNNLQLLGLDGLEIYHISNERKNQIEYYKRVAEDRHLLVTGGSDFHGMKNKKTKIGDYGIDENEYQNIVKYLKRNN